MIIQKYCDLVLKIALTVTVIFIGILGWVPPVCRDSLTHHLYIPKLYLKSGSIHQIAYVPFSYYPQLLDLLYMIPLYFKNDIIPKYIHFCFAIATAFLIYSYLKNRLDKKAGLAGTLFFLTIPVIVKLSVTVYVDLGLICFTFASIIYLFKWKNAGLRWRYLILSGLFTGLAMGTKYNGAVTLILLSLLLPLLIPPQQRQRLKAFLFPLVFTITALLVFSPWIIKNYIWTGNPFYPIQINAIKIDPPEKQVEEDTSIEENKKKSSGNNKDNSIKNKDNSIKTDQTKSINHFLVRKHVYHEQWWETLLIPVRIFFQGEDDNPALFDGKLNPFLLIIPLWLLILNFIDKKIIGKKITSKKIIEKEKSKKESMDNKSMNNESMDSESMDSEFMRKEIIDREVIFLLLFSALYIILVFLRTDMRIRYIAPIIPPLVIVYIYGIYKIKEYFEIQLPIFKSRMFKSRVFKSRVFKSRVFKSRVFSDQTLINIIMTLIYFITIYNNIIYSKALFLQITPFDYISGKVSRREYINRFRPEYELIEYLNNTASNDSKVLALFLGNRGYYFENEVRFGTELLFNAVRASVYKNDILNQLKKEGFTYIIVGFDLFKKWIQNNLKQEEYVKMRYFFDNQAILIKENGFYGLYKFKSADR